MSFKIPLTMNWLLLVACLSNVLATDPDAKCVDFEEKTISGECKHTSVEVFLRNVPLTLDVGFSEGFKDHIDNLTISIDKCKLSFRVAYNDGPKISFIPPGEESVSFDGKMRMKINAEQISLYENEQSKNTIDCNLDTTRDHDDKLKVPIRWDASSTESHIFLKVVETDAEVRLPEKDEPKSNTDDEKDDPMSKWWIWFLIGLGVLVLLIGIALSVTLIVFCCTRHKESEKARQVNVVINQEKEQPSQTEVTKNSPPKLSVVTKERPEATEDNQAGDLNLVRMNDRDQDSIRVQGF